MWPIGDDGRSSSTYVCYVSRKRVGRLCIVLGRLLKIAMQPWRHGLLLRASAQNKHVGSEEGSHIPLSTGEAKAYWTEKLGFANV